MTDSYLFKQGPLFALVLLGFSSTWAQQKGAGQEVQMTITADNPIPESTIVPILRPPEVVGERTSEPDHSMRGLSRKERRALKAEEFRNQIDSLVESRSFLFWPNSMQRIPDGSIQLIYNGYYYFGLYEDHVEVHLPFEERLTSFVGVFNFDTMEIRDYLATPLPAGWQLCFRIPDGDENYLVEFRISNLTGESILTLGGSEVSTRYVGTIRPPGDARK